MRKPMPTRLCVCPDRAWGLLALAALTACGGGGDPAASRSVEPGETAIESPGPRALSVAGAVPVEAAPRADAAPVPTAFSPTVYDPAAPDRVTIGTIVVGDTRYNDVVIAWGQLLAAGTDPPITSWNSYDPASGRVTLPKVRLGDSTYTNVVVTLAGLVSVGGTAALAPVIPDDPLFGDQWHLNNTGQAGPSGQAGLAGEDLRVTMAWNHVTGAGVRIAVVDDGLDITHEDFDVVAGKSWDYRTNAYGDPSGSESSHGTSPECFASSQG